MKYIPTINIHAAVEIVASASCSLSLLYLLTTGSIYRLIAPNSYIIALLWALTLLLLWSTIKASKNIFRRSYGSSYRNAILYGLCTLLLSPSIFHAQAFALPAEEPVDQVISITKEPVPTKDYKNIGDGIDDTHRHITLTSKNYYDTILKVSNHIEKYKGYTVTATGYISYHDKALQGNDFVLARDLMICCVADMSPFGLPTEYSSSTPLLEHTWYTMEGTIGTRNFHGVEQPYIINSKITQADAIDGYIFPN